MAQIQKDTTGAGKTLDKLMDWWDRTFPERTNHRELHGVMNAYFNHEVKVYEHVRLVINDVQYPYLKEKLRAFLSRQSALIEILKQRIVENGSKEPVRPEFVFQDEFGVRLSLDLREIHDMYNQYVFQAAVADDEGTRDFMQKLADEKHVQTDLLSDMVTKIHN
jgi:hypothetical protein